MDTTTQTPASDAAPAQSIPQPQRSYIMGLLRYAARIVVAILTVPLLMWHGARAYGHKASEAAEAASSGTAALKTTIAGGSMLTFGGLTANDLAVLAGVVATAIGIFFQWRRDQRERREHEARLRAIEAGREQP